MKVALVYDRVNKWGGAERVLLTLHEMFLDAPLYTSVYNSKTAPWAKVFPKIYTSFLQKIPFALDKHEHFAYLMPIAFETFSFDQYDLVISITSEAAKGVITKPYTKHICYCLTPTRYLWSHYEIYFQGKAWQAVAKPVVSYLRKWDKTAAQRSDVMVGISTSVRERIKKYYGRESGLVYPPVDTNKFEIRNTKFEINPKHKEYFLVVSRLVPYKRVDLVVEAFNELNYPLVIVGTGSEENRLKSMANRNIRFVGQLTDKELAVYYQNAKALIFPGEEDFGMVMVEAQAAGTPVIAYKKGGALDVVIDPTTASGSATGTFFEGQTKHSLIEAIEIFEKTKFSKSLLYKNAQKFSKERFKKEFSSLIGRYARYSNK